MFPTSEVGPVYEAAAMVAIVSAAFAMVSLGGLAVAQSDPGSRVLRVWIASAWISWSVFVLSMCGVAALSTVQ